jgi:hypothetical protein
MQQCRAPEMQRLTPTLQRLIVSLQRAISADNGFIYKCSNPNYNNKALKSPGNDPMAPYNNPFTTSGHSALIIIPL